MAWWYVNSAASGTNAGTSWTNACTSLSQLLGLGTPPAAGDSIAILSTSAESYSSSTTLAFPGTLTSPIFIYSCDNTNAPPQSTDVLAGVSVTTTGNSGLTLNGSFYCYGVTFNCATGSFSDTLALNNTTNNSQVYDTCTFSNVGTGSTGKITIGTNAANSFRTVLTGCILKFAAVGHTMLIAGQTYIKGGSIAASGSVPTTLFQGAASGTCILEGVDLSAFGSGKTLVAAGVADNLTYYIKDCKLGASVVVAATPTQIGLLTYLSRSDSGNTNYRQEKYDYFGTETTETTIVRTGGAAQADGTAFSRKYVGNAAANPTIPFYGMPIAVWNPYSSGTHTVTIYGIWTNGSLPNNDQFWCDLEYLGTSGYPLGVFVSGTKTNNLAAGGAQTSDSSTWGGSTTAFVITLSYSPTKAGYLFVYPKSATTTAVYIDPKLVVA